MDKDNQIKLLQSELTYWRDLAQKQAELLNKKELELIRVNLGLRTLQNSFDVMLKKGR